MSYSIEKEFLAEESGLNDSAFADSNEMSWKDGLVMRMLELEFISDLLVDEVLEILKPFQNEDDAFEVLSKRECKLSIAIANATQI